MKYKILSAKMEKVVLSDDRKYISIDYTINGEGVDVDGELKLPINTGTTISNIPLLLGEEMPDYAENKVIEWFNSIYKSK